MYLFFFKLDLSWRRVTDLTHCTCLTGAQVLGSASPMRKGSEDRYPFSFPGHSVVYWLTVAGLSGQKGD